jgi:hypothetical protein
MQLMATIDDPAGNRGQVLQSGISPQQMIARHGPLA